MPFHVLASGFFCLLFISIRFAGGLQQRVIVIADFGADHHLKLPGVGETAFNHRQLFDLFWSGVRGLVEHKAQASNAVAHRGDVVAPANQVNQPVDIGLFYFAHRKASWQRR